MPLTEKTMSDVASRSNGKMQTAFDLEEFRTKMENNFQIVDKNFVTKVLRILSSIMTIVQRKEDGIFNVTLKWFRFYLKLNNRINPDNKKLLKYYENSAPTIITYIIGCLQYKTKEVSNYHYNLLEILEELLENTQPSILQKINNFEVGTIGCLWHPIGLVGDFNTQSKVLKILSMLLKQFDEVRQNEEIKCIKWTNLNLFQHKLKAVVQDTKLPHVLENSSRDLLNNYNMNLSKNVLVYSFYCKSMILGNKYKFYKPLRLQKFWVDINYCPKTLSYSGRFKLNSNSKFELVNVILKIQSIMLEKNILQIYFNKPGEFSQYSEYLSNINDNVIRFTLTKEEKDRLLNNDYVIEYFNSLRRSDIIRPTKTEMDDKKTFDLLKNEMSKSLQENIKNRSSVVSNLCKKSFSFNNNSNPEQNFKFVDGPQFQNSVSKVPFESSKTSKNEENVEEKLPARKLRDKRKFFTSLLTENSDEEFLSKKLQRKRTRNPKSRQTKSRSKQVCKVTPTVDLTKTDNMDSVEKTETKSSIEKNTPPENISKTAVPLLTSADCDEILKQVADIYEAGDTTYAKPCQSYRNFQIQQFPTQKPYKNNESTKEMNRKKKLKLENECSIEKKRKTSNCHSQANKENINPETSHKDGKHGPLSMTTNITSPYLFETQCSDVMPPINKLPQIGSEKNKNKFSENMEIDLISQQIEHTPISCEPNCDKDAVNKENTFSSSSLDCEVRGLNESYLEDIEYICTPTKLNNSSNLSTPRPTSAMNISNLNDSDIEITQVYNGPINNMEKHISNTKNMKNNSLRMELENSSNNSNFVAEQQPADCEAIKENIEVPIYLQQILNDFEFSSDSEFDSSYKTPQKVTICDVMTQRDCRVLKKNREDAINLQGNLNDFRYNSDNEFNPSYETPKSSFKKMVEHEISNDLAKRNYYRDCVVFQNRRDTEESSSSDEDIDCNFQKSNKESTNQALPVVENRPLFLNKKSFQQTDKWAATPDKNLRISKSMTSRMVAKCQVTPSAIIMQKFQVSAKKSILINSKSPKSILKANKCLKDGLANKTFNKQSVALQQETFKLQRKNLNNYKQANWTQIPRKTLTYYPKLGAPQKDPKDFKNNAIFKTSSNQTSNETSAPTIQQQKSESEKDLFNCSPYNVSHQNTPFENSNKLFKKDLLRIIDDYNKNITLSVNNALCLGLKNISDVYNRKFLEITKAVLKKSNEHKMELDEIRSNIGRLVRELEWQYDAFNNKSKQFDIHKEMTERVLDSILNTDVLNSITKNYEDVLNKLNVERNEVFKKVWQTYLERH